MSIQFLVPAVKDLREGFKHKASSMRIDAKPTQISVGQLHKYPRANLQSIPFLLPGVLGQSWEFLVMTEAEWANAYHLKQGTNHDDKPKPEEGAGEGEEDATAEKAKAVTIPPTSYAHH